jgi:hypothetical protein
MSFISPLFLAGVFAAALPVLLHLLKREPEPRVKFSAVRLLKQAPIELTRRRRMRDLVLFALRVAALILLAVAFARPFFGSGAAVGLAEVTMIAIDTSYSMSAPGRLERAKRLAAEAVGHLPKGDLVGVLTFDDAPHIEVKPSADRGLALSAIDAATTGFGATSYGAALNLAAEALGNRGDTIAIVTDLQDGGWSTRDSVSLPGSTRIQLLDVGALQSNLAITSFRLVGAQFIVSVRNAGASARDAHVRLSVDGRPAGQVDARIAPTSSVDLTLQAPNQGSAAEATVDDPEGMQADNVRYLVLGNAGPQTVLVVTGGGNLGREAFYIQRALESGTGSVSFHAEAADAVQLSAWEEAMLDRYAAVLLLSTRGLERRGREALTSYVQHGGGLLIVAGPDMDGAVVADVLGAGSPIRIAARSSSTPSIALSPTDWRHPVFQPFRRSAGTLGLVRFQHVATIDGRECQTVARFTTGEAALIDCLAGEGHGLVFASDLNNRWNDFPLHASFVPFVHEAIRYLASPRARAEDYLVADAPAGVKHVPGIATIQGRGPGGIPGPVAVNVDPRESDLTRMTEDEFRRSIAFRKDNGVTQASLESQQEDRQQLWWYAIAMMLVALAFEGIVAGRAS